LTINDSNPVKPSKTFRKAAMHALQDLGARIVDLREDQIRRLSLPERLSDAVLACQRIHKREARRRQLQLIGKLMRSIDPTPVAEAVQQMLPANASPARNRVKVPTVPVRGNVSDLADP
jgi:ribosome-associated protein